MTEGGIKKVENADSRIYHIGKDPRPFVKMYVHLDEKNGLENATVDGKKMEQENIFTSTNNLPEGSEYKDDAFFAINDKRGVVPVMVPISTTPMSLHSEKQQMGYFPKAQDNFAGGNIGADIMQGLMQIDNAE